jgi:hypothetical protein
MWPIKSRLLCRLSYGAKMWSAGFEPATPPRFKRALYLVGATTTRMGEAGLESGYAPSYV